MILDSFNAVIRNYATKKDVDFKKRLIFIDHQLCRTAEKPYFVKSPKTSSGVRCIPMSDVVYMALKRVAANRQPPTVELLVDGHSGFLFLDKAGMPKVAMHLENYMRGMQKKMERIYGKSFPRVTPHVLRHTFCTNMQRAGIDVKSLQYLIIVSARASFSFSFLPLETTPSGSTGRRCSVS